MKVVEIFKMMNGVRRSDLCGKNRASNRVADIEQFSGAMFNKRGEAIQAGSAMTDDAYVRRFTEASERLARKALGNKWPDPGTRCLKRNRLQWA
jgi:hypothetical protein